MPTSATEKHLRTQLDELQRQYDTLTKRMAALDTDIGRELDSERKLVLQERRADLDAERKQIVVGLTQIDQQLSSLEIAQNSSADEKTERCSTISRAGTSISAHIARCPGPIRSFARNLRDDCE